MFNYVMCAVICIFSFEASFCQLREGTARHYRVIKAMFSSCISQLWDLSLLRSKQHGADRHNYDSLKPFLF